jgi:predicted component of type VI protein secretion system
LGKKAILMRRSGIVIGSQKFRFIVKKGPNPGHVYPVFADKMTIGRDPMSDIIFKDPEVSRRHVQFIRDSESYLVEDLGSTNGTFVDGKRLTGQAMSLQVGQEVALGGAITLIFETADSQIDLAALSNNSIPASPTTNSNTAVPPDPFAEYRLDDDYDDDDGDELEDLIEESPHIDQLPSLPVLQNKAPLHTRVLQSANKPKEVVPPAPANAKTFTNQQIIYLVIGTAVTTVVACGILLFIVYMVRGNTLLN